MSTDRVDIADLVAKLDAPVEAGNPANRDAVVLYFDKVEEVSELRRIVVAAKEYVDGGGSLADWPKLFAAVRGEA